MPNGPNDTEAATPLERYRELRETNALLRDPSQKLIDAGTTDSASYVNGARYIMVSGIYEVA